MGRAKREPTRKKVHRKKAAGKRAEKAMSENCTHPKSKRKNLGYAVICECGEVNP